MTATPLTEPRHGIRVRCVLALVLASIVLAPFWAIPPFASTLAKSAWQSRTTYTINVGGSPVALAVDQQTNMVYATTAATIPELSVINGSSNRVIARVNLSSASGTATFDPSKDRLYITEPESNSVVVLDPSTGATLVSIGVGEYPQGIGVNPASGRVYVANQRQNTVSVIDTSTEAVIATVKVGNNPLGVAVNPVTNLVYVSDLPTGISVINGSTNDVLARIGLEDQVFGVAVNPSSNTIYAALFFSKTVDAIDGLTNNVVARVSVDTSTDSPSGLAVNSMSNTIYVGNRDKGTVSVINGPTNILETSARVGEFPLGVAVNSLTGTVYVANYKSGTISVVSNGPGPTATDVTCDSSYILIRTSTTCTVDVVGSSPGGVVTWSSKGSGGLSFSPSACTLVSGRCEVNANGTVAGSTVVVANYGGDSVNPASEGNFTIFVSDPARAKAAIVQHKYVIPTLGIARFNLTTDSPVTKGNLLVVGVVFASNLTGSVSDSLGNSWSRTGGGGGYPNDPQIGVRIWWSVLKISGNDTITISSQNSVEMVDEFEIRGADASTVAESNGGGFSGPGDYQARGIANVNCTRGCYNSGGVFVLVVAGSNALGNETCAPMLIGDTPPQTPGFTIEPYCGMISPYSHEQVYGEYGVTDGPGFSVSLGASPYFGGYVLTTIFIVDPSLNSSSSVSSTTITTSSESNSTIPEFPIGLSATLAVALVIAAMISYSAAKAREGRRSSLH